MIGQTISHYRILEELGRGGMGIVYKALDLKLNREVAVKILPPKLVANPGRKRRFVQEAQAAAALRHPNIAVIHEIDEIHDVGFIVMELIEGEVLRDVLADGPLPFERGLEIATEVADGLANAHQRGIIHRDLKPGNIMLGDDGHPKIIDFGLAKLAPPLTMVDSQAETAFRHETEPGGLIGTVAYMSPEQARGLVVDHRSDLFSFGIILHQMLTGVSPFERSNAADTLSAILNNAPPPISPPPDKAGSSMAELQGIVDKCLAKNADGRYGETAELVSALQAVGRGDGVQLRKPQAKRWPHVRGLPERAVRVGLAAAVLLTLAATYAILHPGRDSLQQVQTASLALLDFQNLSGDEELDWLGNGIPQMLAIDLSQSPEFDVLSTARLHQNLEQLDLLEPDAIPLESIQQLSKQANVNAVVRGHYLRVGDRFRIAFTVEDAESGAILQSSHTDGEGEASLFAMMDEISEAIRNGYEVERPASSPPTIAAATTTSLEALRLFTEGIDLSNEFKWSEAAARLERAIELDPDFALALAELSSLYSDMGQEPLADHYMRRALDLVHRLPVDERFGVQGRFYGSRWATFDRAIEIYEEGLELYPNHEHWRNNLARRYAFQERYVEAIAQFDELIERGDEFAGDYFDMANARTALGQFEVGYRLLSDYAALHPDEWFAQHGLGWFLTEWGRLEEAEERFDAADALRPGDWSIPYARWRAAVLGENWQDAARYAAEVAGTNEPMAHWRGSVSHARNALYHGQAREALQFFDQAATSYAEPNGYTALARCWKAELLLEMGAPVQAAHEARLARESSVDEWPERYALMITVLAHEAIGEAREADAIAGELRQMWQEGIDNVDERHYYYLQGRLGLLRGDVEAAVEALRRAASLLPPRGVEFHWHVYPNHLPIWVALGEAELAAGNTDVALSWFERAADSRSEHLEQPRSYVRSFYLLGKSHEERGDLERAREYYERFLEFWTSGDMDPERVKHARSVSSL